MQPPERLPERDAAIEAMLPQVPFDGWTFRALRAGLTDIGMPADEAELLFPGRPRTAAAEMIAVFCDLADRKMIAASAALTEARVSGRVKAIIALRLRMNQPHKEAIRRAASVLALPGNARTAAAIMARTVDAIWQAAGDRSADFNWYTKRATLTAVYGSTMLFWLRDNSGDDSDTMAFVERRLRGVGRIGRFTAQIETRLGRFKPA